MVQPGLNSDDMMYQADSSRFTGLVGKEAMHPLKITAFNIVTLPGFLTSNIKT
jgi:hypothetical protein